MTAKQRQNLLKLATYLESLPKNYSHFDMFSFADHEGDCDLPIPPSAYAALKPRAFLDNCGTVACAVGHGPAAGIKPLSSEIKRGRDNSAHSVDWTNYTERAFGVNAFGEEFDFLFQSTWVRIDNDHYGAAARIRYFLATGRPLLIGHTARKKYAPYRKGSRSAVRRQIERVSA